MTTYLAKSDNRFLCWGPTKTAAQKQANTLANWRFVTIAPFDFKLSPLAAPNAAKDTK